MRNLGRIGDHTVVLLLRAVFDGAKAHAFCERHEGICGALRSFAGHENIGSVIKEACLTGVEPAALLARHGVAADVNERVVFGDLR